MVLSIGKTGLRRIQAFRASVSNVSCHWNAAARSFSWRPRLALSSAIFFGVMGSLLSSTFCASARADSYRIAFASSRDTPTNSNIYEIYVMNSDGSGQTRLTNSPAIDYEPSFSPDGTRILWTSTRTGHGEIFVMNADGSNQQQLTTTGSYDANTRAKWSHDGTKICYLHYDSAIRSNEIWIMNPNGSGARRVTFNTMDERRLSWNADDTRIAFDSASSNSQIYVVNADGTGFQRLITRLSTDFGPQFSPLGDKISFSSRDDFNGNGSFAPKLFAMNLDGTDLTRLGNRDGYESEPIWSPDAAQIAFQSDASPTGSRDIWVMNSNGTGAVNLTNVAGSDVHPAWGPLPASLSIINANMVEGDSGTRSMVFTVSLSRASTAAISVNYATADNAPASAIAGSDYTPLSGTLSFAPGQVSKTINVPIIGDSVIEPDETFVVNLSGATGSQISKAQGVGTILNDDTITWTAVDLATDAANLSHLLWTSSDGQMEVSRINAAYEVQGKSQLYGPYGSWRARAIAVGADGRTRVLWNETVSGETSVWTLSSTGERLSLTAIAPRSGWTAVDLAVDGDNNTRLLWGNEGGWQTWRLQNNDYTVLNQGPVYQIGGGWNARALAVGGDGMTRALLSNADGRGSFWTLYPDGSFYESSPAYGPYSSGSGLEWGVAGLASAPGSSTRILWKRRDNAFSFWNVDPAYNAQSGPGHGPFSGWSARAISVGGDGKTRQLLNNVSGETSLWTVSPTGDFESSSPAYPKHP